MGARPEFQKDSYRAWCGVRKVRDVTIGETHSEKAQRLAKKRLIAQMKLERAFKP